MIGSLSPNCHLLVHDTGTAKGRGVFAGRGYRAGEVVEQSPMVVVASPWLALPPEVRALVYDWGQLCGRGAGVEHALALGPGSLFNHAPVPNLVYRACPEKRTLEYVARIEIPEGTELTIDYNADIPPADVAAGLDWFSATGITLLPEDDADGGELTPHGS